MAGNMTGWPSVCRQRQGEVENFRRGGFSCFILMATFEGQNVHPLLQPQALPFMLENVMPNPGTTVVTQQPGLPTHPYLSTPYTSAAVWYLSPHRPRTPVAPSAVGGYHSAMTSSHKRTTICFSAPQLAGPFLKLKSLNPKVITQCA